jgi:subtilisin family serine protease
MSLLRQLHVPLLLAAVLSSMLLHGATVAEPNDPFYSSKGSWGQEHDDQWAIKRVGFTDDRQSAWNLVGKEPKPVIVAVVDTGLDWNHRDLDWERIWRNEDEIPNNRIDDDRNGYIDDVVGWDFWRNNNTPWDRDGHGTFVTGLIAATRNNGVGIAGLNPYARIMILKAMNSFGNTRASHVSRAILYAADNGADILNLSLGGKGLSRTAQEAIDYARQKGVLIVVAAGNDGVSTDDFGPAGAENVLTVAATGPGDERAGFSNWGKAIKIAAPGVDVLSLRARRTDMLLAIPEVEYEAEQSFVGEDRRYYRAGGTSFAAPLVTAVASLLLSKNPDLTAEQIERMILHSAEDIEAPGVDQVTGYGMLNARAALAADPAFFVEAKIDEVGVVQKDDKHLVQVKGVANADEFEEAWLELGAGEEPKKWKTVGDRLKNPVDQGVLGEVDSKHFSDSKVWFLRIRVKHKNGMERENQFRLALN